MFNIIKKLFGTKYDRDVNTYNPIIEEINEIYEGLSSLSNDELRDKTIQFKERIAEYLSDIDNDIKSIKEESEKEEDLARKEDLFAELDKIAEDRNKALEEVLKEILPDAFAVTKETARRFSQNETIEVTATDHDRELAVRPGKSRS